MIEAIMLNPLLFPHKCLQLLLCYPPRYYSKSNGFVLSRKLTMVPSCMNHLKSRMKHNVLIGADKKGKNDYFGLLEVRCKCQACFPHKLLHSLNVGLRDGHRDL